MKKVVLFTASFVGLCITSGWSQWQTRIGVNALLLPLRTLEVTAEFKRHPWYSLTLNTGYVAQSGYMGLGEIKVDDMIRERSTSGFFTKVGGRLYLLSFSGKELATNVFIGAQFLGPSYHQKAILRRQTMDADGGITFSPVPVKASGILAGAVFTGGLTFNVSKRFQLDAGVQYGLPARRSDYIGSIDRNYQTGFGIIRGGKNRTSLQGLIVLSYLL